MLENYSGKYTGSFNGIEPNWHRITCIHDKCLFTFLNTVAMSEVPISNYLFFAKTKNMSRNCLRDWYLVQAKTVLGTVLNVLRIKWFYPSAWEFSMALFNLLVLSTAWIILDYKSSQYRQWFHKAIFEEMAFSKVPTICLAISKKSLTEMYYILLNMKKQPILTKF